MNCSGWISAKASLTIFVQEKPAFILPFDLVTESDADHVSLSFPIYREKHDNALKL